MKAYELNGTGGTFVTGSGRLVALTLVAGSGAAATAYLYDDRSSASGPKLAMVAAVAGTTHTLNLGPRGLPYENGLSVALTGAGAEVFAYVEKV